MWFPHAVPLDRGALTQRAQNEPQPLRPIAPIAPLFRTIPSQLSSVNFPALLSHYNTQSVMVYYVDDGVTVTSYWRIETTVSNLYWNSAAAALVCDVRIAAAVT